MTVTTAVSTVSLPFPVADCSSSASPTQYTSEHDLPIVMDLIDKSLSEPYSVFTYRYFLQQWPNLCYLAFDGAKAVGVIVCKMDDHRGHLRGYIAMLVVDNTYRGRGLGTQLCCCRGGCECRCMPAAGNGGSSGRARQHCIYGVAPTSVRTGFATQPATAHAHALTPAPRCVLSCCVRRSCAGTHGNRGDGCG